MRRAIRLFGRLIWGLAEFCVGLVLLIAFLPILVPWLSNMQHAQPMSVLGQVLLAWLLCVLGVLLYFAVHRCFASWSARDDHSVGLRALEAFKRKRAAIEGRQFSDQDRKIVDDAIREAETDVRSTATKLSRALRDDVLSLLVWRRIHLRQSALASFDAVRSIASPQRENVFVGRLSVNQASIDAALSVIRQMADSYGADVIAAPSLPETPLFTVYSVQGGPQNGVLRFFWRISDAHVCVLKSVATVLSAYCLNFAYRGGMRRVKRAARVCLWAVNAVLVCCFAVVVLAVPPLAVDRDSPVGRRCAEALCRFYVKFTPQVRINGPAGPETADVPYLHAAATTGRHIAVESFVAAGADTQAGALNKGPTARELAAFLGHEELLDLLPTEQSDPLSVAVTQSNLSRARWLIWNSGRRDIVNVPDRFGISPLHYAVSSGNLDGVRLLIDNKADTNIRSETFPLTPLHVAAFRGNIGIVEFLLANGADPVAMVEDAENSTPFMAAKMVANLGRTQRRALELLLRVPLCSSHYHAVARTIEDVEVIFPYPAIRMVRIEGSGIRSVSGRRSYDKLMKVLQEVLVQGNVNAKDEEGLTALIRACGLGLADVAELLIKNGADVNATGHAEGTAMNALLGACIHGNARILKLLIDNGADVDATLGIENLGNVTTLMVLAGHGRVDLVKLLVENGADVNAKGEQNVTALMMASSQGDSAVISYLLEMGAEINAQTRPDNETALMAAVMCGHAEAVKTLVAKGADVTIRNGRGKTAMMLAREKKNEEIARIIGSGH